MSFAYTAFFLRRWCPRQCAYCKAKDVRGERILKAEEWLRFFRWAQDQGFKFHLCLGNEPLAYPDLIPLVKGWKEMGLRYTLYSTFPTPFYERLREPLVEAGVESLSCGVDLPPSAAESLDLGSISAKARRGLEALLWFKEHGVPGLLALITFHRLNYRHVLDLARFVNRLGLKCSINPVEWSHDGQHDFFGTREELGDYAFRPEDESEVRRVLLELADAAESGEIDVQPPPDLFRWWAGRIVDLKCKCRRPSILSIEEDGSLRLCAYRRGEAMPRYSIFDLMDGKVSLTQLEDVWRRDWQNCPGCCWAFWFMIDYYEEHGVEKEKIVNYDQPEAGHG